MHAVGLGGAVTDHVIAHFTARRLNRLIDLTRRYSKAFRHNLKVIDEGFHLRLHLLAIGENDLKRVSFYPALWHAVQRLLHNADRLPQLGYPAHVPRKNVAVLAHRDLEFEILVSRVR